MAYIRNNNRYMLNDDTNVETFEKLPPGNYLVKFDNFTGQYFVEAIDPFHVHDRIYGSLPRMAERIASTYERREHSTGALLTGEKGSGKSLLCRIICGEAAKRGVPTLVVTSPWNGEVFNQFIQRITQQCIILFDEFEKVYEDDSAQEALLSLLDGVFPTKKLFLMTCNNRHKIDENMINRPGRLFYNIDFKCLDTEFIEDYCSENLDDKSQTEDVLRLASLYERFNFDMLKALVEEMNRYEESAMEAVSMLNIKPVFGSQDHFEASLCVEGAPVEVTDEMVYVDPLGSHQFNLYSNGHDDEDCKRFSFSSADLKEVIGKTGEYIYVKGNARLTLKRVVHQSLDVNRLYAS